MRRESIVRGACRNIQFFVTVQGSGRSGGRRVAPQRTAAADKLYPVTASALLLHAGQRLFGVFVPLRRRLLEPFHGLALIFGDAATGIVHIG